MDKFLMGFVLGAVIGGGLAILLAPDEKTKALRDRVRKTTDLYASGDESPGGTIAGFAAQQRNRIDMAVAAGKRANAERQAELWSQLQLPPSNEAT